MELKNKIQIRIKEKPDVKMIEDYMDSHHLTNVSAFLYEMIQLGIKTKLEEEEKTRKEEECESVRIRSLEEKIGEIDKKMDSLASSLDRTDSLISAVGIEVEKGNQRISSVIRNQEKGDPKEEKILSSIHNILRENSSSRMKKAIDNGDLDALPERFKKEESI